MTRWSPAALAVVGSLAWSLPGRQVDDHRLASLLEAPGLIDCARRHKVLAAVGSAAADLLDDSPQRAEIADFSRKWSMTAMRTAQKTVQLHAILADAGCRPLVLKGVVLSMLTTGNPVARGPGDIDILVDGTRIARARRVLESLGATTSIRLSSEIHAVTYQWGDCWVDLHHRVDKYPGMGVASADLWDRSQAVPIAGQQVRTLGPADSAVFAAVTAGMDTWSQLVRVVDFVQLIRNPLISDLEQCVGQWRASHLLDLAFAVCRRLDGDLPHGTATSEALAARAWLWIAADRLLRLDQDLQARALRDVYRLAATRDPGYSGWWLTRNLRRPLNGQPRAFLQPDTT